MRHGKERTMTIKPPSAVRVAIYARVSSEQQAQEQTIASQVAALRQRVADDGFELPDELCFLDEGLSGSTLMRPALERLRDAAYVGAFQKLYVHSPDRLARRYAYQVLLVDELTKHGVEIAFLNRAIGVSPEEDLLLQMQGMFAEYERAKILERSRRGKRHAAASTCFPERLMGIATSPNARARDTPRTKSTKRKPPSSSRSLNGSDATAYRLAR
jgi:site-specific DNA recombinase